ncbi:hypothetical protein Desaci_1694 [Desulfosporosinus acidiphilus SJ4]|uniref:Uncharacterized protein n=2 Tax=Desulfosporosinus TaxID=79206 RepID=I4D4G2_DESAJ|nr:hypothetical protein Desaci_1694 [Desulfosporosinus acidiphilus SJ4]
MCGMPFFGTAYGNQFGFGCGIRPGFGAYGACGAYGNYGSYGHLQGYGVGLHPGYDSVGGGYNYFHVGYYPVTVSKPYKNGKG